MVKTNKRDRVKDLYSPSMIPMDVCQGPGIPDLVSVLIPTYNRDYILDKALDSVFLQDYPSFEVIVVDDGSVDKTEELMSRYLNLYPDKIKYVKKANGGLVSARNEGLRHARGEFIALQDSDDIWLQGKLKHQVEIMKRHPEVALCWNQIHLTDDNGNLIAENAIASIYHVYQSINLDDYLPKTGVLNFDNKETIYRKNNVFKTLFLGNLIHPPDVLIRRSAIQKSGGLDQTYHYAAEDYEFFWRVSEFGEGAFIERAGMLYRTGAADQMTNVGQLLLIALGNEKALKTRIQKYPKMMYSLGKSIVKKHMLDAHLWVLRSEFAADFGKKSNALRAFFDAFTISPIEAIKVIPFMIFYSLPSKIRLILRS